MYKGSNHADGLTGTYRAVADDSVIPIPCALAVAPPEYFLLLGGFATVYHLLRSD